MTKSSQNKFKIAVDLDGTIIDSSKRHLYVLNDALKELKQSINTDDYLEYKRNGNSTFFYLLNKGFDETLAKTITSRWTELIENENYLKYDELYSDSVKFLEKNFTNFDLILITARNNKNGTLFLLDKLNISKYFKHIFIVPTGANAGDTKAKTLKSYNPIAIIGDSEVDYNTAKKLDITFYTLHRGFRNKDFWIKKRLKNTYESLLEINLTKL